MKKIIEHFKTEWNKKTDPNKPIFTGVMVQMFILRILLVVFVYILTRTFIVQLNLLQLFLIDALLQFCTWFCKFVHGRTK